MSEWKIVNIGDYISFQNGYAFNSKTFSSNGKYLVVRIKEIKNGFIKFFPDSAKVDVENEFAFNKYKVEEGDILFALTGDPVSRNNHLSWVGRIAIYNHKKTALLNQRVCKVIFGEDIYPLFFYYYFRLEENLFDLARRATGSANQANISTNTISKMQIKLPPLETQKKISAVLSALDDKIELNNAINKNLEEQAQAIFDNFFIEDNRFVEMDSELLSDLCEVITKGTTPTTLGKKFVAKGINFIKAESIQDNHSIDFGKISYIDEETQKTLKRSIIKDEDILFTIAGTLGRFTFVDKNVLPANTNQAVAIIRTDKKKINPRYVYSFFLCNWHMNHYKKLVQQSVQANLSLTTIKSLSIPILSNEQMKNYNKLIEPIIFMVKSNQHENKKLGELRDALLPRLMSGEIDVSKVEI